MLRSNLKRCNDPQGRSCFGYRRGRCTCLNNTNGVPCPFFKTIKQVLAEDPNYFIMNNGGDDNAT